MDMNWIYFENSKKMLHLSDFSVMFFEEETGNLVLRNKYTNQYERITDKQDIQNFKRNILKLGDDE